MLDVSVCLKEEYNLDGFLTGIKVELRICHKNLVLDTQHYVVLPDPLLTAQSILKGLNLI